MFIRTYCYLFVRYKRNQYKVIPRIPYPYLALIKVSRVYHNRCLETRPCMRSQSKDPKCMREHCVYIVTSHIVEQSNELRVESLRETREMVCKTLH